MMELGYKTFSSVSINCDCTGAQHLGGNVMYSSRTKYTALRFFFLRVFKTAKITIHHMDTGKMLTDAATKCLGRVQHRNTLHQVKELSC